MTHPPTASSASRAGFDGTIGIRPDFPYHIQRGDSFENLERAISGKKLLLNSFARTTEDNRLFYYNREGKLYELTFTEVDHA